jgi:hypothetical protein
MLSSTALVSIEDGVFELRPACSFVLAMAPALSRACIAAAYVSVVENVPTIEIGHFDLDKQRHKHLLSLPTMERMNLCSNQSGSAVAVSQGKDIYVIDLNGSQRVIRFDAPVEQLGFVKENILLLRCGTRLLSLELGASKVCLIKSNVRRIAIGRFVVALSTSGTLDITDGSRVIDAKWKIFPNIIIPNGSRTFVKSDDNAVFISAEGPNHDGKRFLSLYRVEIGSQESALLFADEIADTIGKESTGQFYPWRNGDALLLAERMDYPRLWLVNGITEPRPLSPEDIEVFQAAPNPASKSIAFVGSDVSEVEKSTARQLILAKNQDALWDTHVLETGSFLLPKWFNSDWLAYAHDVSEDHSWNIAAKLQQRNVGIRSATMHPDIPNNSKARPLRREIYHYAAPYNAPVQRGDFLRSRASSSANLWCTRFLLSPVVIFSSPKTGVISSNRRRR